MRMNSTQNSFLTVGFVVAMLWLVAYYLASGTGDTASYRREVEEKDKLQIRFQKLASMVEENHNMLDKLSADIIHQKHDLLGKIRTEISAQYKVTHVPAGAAVVAEKEQREEQKSNILPGVSASDTVIPIVITACNRPSVSRCLDKLFSVRNNLIKQFPIIVSQDCGDKATADVLQGYSDKITFLKHEPEPVPPGVKSNLIGYYKISSHYKFAISQAFQLFPDADSIIILEDDIEIAPDFLSYFSAMHKLLIRDPTLWCASAWNDNGKTNLIESASAGAELLYRTDFFPGLGWMLKRSLWEEELVSKWPAAFWDDWMRQPDQRKGRACIRPEISRTSTFGRKGVSGGQFFDTHLKYIKLNDVSVDWNTKDLSYLIKENYDKSYRDKVYGAPWIRVSDLKDNKSPDEREVRIEYTMAASFKAFAKDLGLMTDFKSGVPRTAYMGIIATIYNGRRVYLAPPQDWQGYDEKWS